MDCPLFDLFCQMKGIFFQIFTIKRPEIPALQRKIIICNKF